MVLPSTHSWKHLRDSQARNRYGVYMSQQSGTRKSAKKSKKKSTDSQASTNKSVYQSASQEGMTITGAKIVKSAPRATRTVKVHVTQFIEEIVVPFKSTTYVEERKLPVLTSPSKADARRALNKAKRIK